MIYEGHNYLPILFQPEMVKAILEGRKTQTRRLHEKPKYKVGDRLWVRERWKIEYNSNDDFIMYNDESLKPIPKLDFTSRQIQGKWQPSIHMPFGAHRIELEVVGVKQERLQDITYDDAIAEGIKQEGANWWVLYDGYASTDSPIRSFASLWRSINGADAWYQNPLVTAYTFKRIMP